MSRHAVIAVIAAVALAACDEPLTLWIAPDGVETEIKFIDHEPPPY